MPQSRDRFLFEIRKSFGLFTKTSDPTWIGYGITNPMAVSMRQGSPQPIGPGFEPVEPGSGGVYNFSKSPGLGFRSEAAWKVWREVIGSFQERLP